MSAGALTVWDMRILHTSDWHIGRSFHGHSTLDALRGVLDALIVQVRENDVDLVIGGARVPRGRYVLQTVPGRDGGKLLVQTEAQAGEAQPGATTTQPGAPVAPREVARIDLRRSTLATPLESLTFWLIPSTQPGAARGELRLAWGTTAFSTDWSVP